MNINFTLIVLFGCLVIAGFVGIIVLVTRLLKKTQQDAEEELQENYPGESVIFMDGANFFGLESLGMGQIRGNGSLILTGSKLLFRQALPARWYEIPLNRITAIETPLFFLGKSKGHKLLVVRYTNEEGEQDAIGWAVRNLEKWVELINRKR